MTILSDSFLEDLGSTNGTLVNGKPIAKHFLRDGDLIDIGRHKLLYFVDDEAIPPSGILKKAMRDAVGDLGEKVELAKPIVRTRQATAAVVRRDAPKQADVAKADESTMRIGAMATSPLSVPAPDAGVAGSPALKFLSGPRAGRAVALTGERMTVGRAGVQLAAIERLGEGFQLKALEGPPPTVNGRLAGADGHRIVAGDVIEILGIKLEFAAPSARDGAGPAGQGVAAAGAEFGAPSLDASG